MRSLAIVTVALASACTTALQPLPTTVCHRSVASEAEGTEREEAAWTSLLVDDGEGRRSSCERALARTPPSEPRCAGAPPAHGQLFAIPPRLAAVARRPGEDDVVWVATHRTADGSLSGPLAIVRHTAVGLEVQALGTHAGPGEQAHPRILRAGPTTLVVIEAAQGDTRVAHLLVQSGGALVPAALDDPTLGCQSPARIVLRRTDRGPAPGGWRERRVRTATIDEEAGTFVVREHLSVEEVDSDGPDARVRARRDSDRVRTLTAAGARLRADRGPIDVEPATAAGSPR